MQTQNKPRVAVIGGGFAGLAAAVELSARRIPVTLFEASRNLGGRARSVTIHQHVVDNGQHILIGAYRECLRLMQFVGATPEQRLLRQPLLLDYPGQLRIAAPRLPAPLHLAAALLSAQGLNWSEKWAAIRFMQSLQSKRFQLSGRLALASVSELLESYRQPPRLRLYLWDALCVAALNTPVESASAQVFAYVLRDSLAGARAASDLLIPRVDLGQLFPEPAAAFIQNHGGQVLCNTAIQEIKHSHTIHKNKPFTLYSAAQNKADAAGYGPYSHLILATAPYHLRALVGDLPALDGLCHQIKALQYEPIVTCYLQYPASVHLSRPMLAYANGLTQWLFDRGQLGGPAGLLAAVISARGRHLELSNHELAAHIHTEIKQLMQQNLGPEYVLPPPLWSQVINEKRGTFSCTPDVQRPAMHTALPGLLLAGDYIASDYPGTLESAVRSGINAAQAIAVSAQ